MTGERRTAILQPGARIRLRAQRLCRASLAVIVLTGCAHNAHSERIRQIRTFEAGYFQSLQQAEYDQAYASLHTEIKSIITPEQYRTYFTVLTDTLGPITAWKELSNPMDRRVALFDRAGRRDPLPPKNQKSMLEARYMLTFEKGHATIIIRTGWEGDRLAIRRQFLCCLPAELSHRLQDHAATLGIGELFGAPRPENRRLRPPTTAPTRPPDSAPSQTPTPPTP
ncbi:MAG TPA: hypothetical protein VML36_06660 [Nitrospiria bacterium]|nr:hypothetical protein [Nitrospiria bacterium]